MKHARVANWFWLLAVLAILAGVSGCTSNEPTNASVRPWNSSEGWQNGAMDGMNYQHE
jgi:hypothetical protein